VLEHVGCENLVSYVDDLALATSFRVSVPYRALKFYLNPNPEWMFVEAASRIRRKEPEHPLNAR
jgi:hypothetical protein